LVQGEKAQQDSYIRCTAL